MNIILKPYVYLFCALFLFSDGVFSQSLDLRDITSALGDIDKPISKSKEKVSDGKLEEELDDELETKDLTESTNNNEEYIEIFQNLTDEQKVLVLEEAERMQKFQELSTNKRKILLQSIQDQESALTFDDEPNYKTVDQTFLKNFGYNLFKENASPLKPILNAAVPSDYIIGNGDEVNIFFYGNDNDEFILEVARNGTIAIPGIGSIIVAGLSFKEMKEVIKQKVESDLIGTTANVSMGELSSIRIYILGEVEKPSSYVVSSLSTVTNALFLSGGVKENGSLRKILLKRNGITIRDIDLYDLLLKGDNTDDVRLQQGDIIFIPAKGKTVSISGEVNRGYNFEVLESDSLKDLLVYSGGYKPNAYQQQSQIKRVSMNGSYKIIDINLELSEEESIELFQGDNIFVPSVSESYEDSVIVSGHFKRPGFYQWFKGMSIDDLILKSGGFLSNTDLKYILLVREYGGGSMETFQFDYSSQPSVESEGFLIEPKDKIVVFSKIEEKIKDIEEKLLEIGDKETAESYLEKQQLLQQIANVEREYDYEFTPEQTFRENYINQVVKRLQDETSYTNQNNASVLFVSGNVRYPSKYPISEGMNIQDALNASGGLKDNTFLESVEITSSILDFNKLRFERRDIDLNDPNNFKYQIKTGDQIVFKSANREIESVVIQGEVFFPGIYSIEEGETLSSLISRAGGLTSKAFAKGAIFTRQSLKIKEEENLSQAAEQLRKQLLLLGANADDSSNSALQDQFILNSIQEEVTSAEAIGRLVFDLEDYLFGSKDEVLINLQDKDTIVIPQISNSVTVIGEVFSPGTFIFDSNLNVDSYLNLSGGPNPYASDDSYIIAANGTIKNLNPSGFFRNRSGLEPGDTIVVPPRVEAFSALKATQNATQVIYQLAVAAAAVSSFNN